MPEDDDLPVRKWSLSGMPWVLSIPMYMVVIEVGGWDITGIPGYIFIIMIILVMFAEFFKSSDINTTLFMMDLIASTAAIAISSMLLGYLIFGLQKEADFHHWMAYGVILGDAILGPYNGFKNALRDVEMNRGVS